MGAIRRGGEIVERTGGVGGNLGCAKPVVDGVAVDAVSGGQVGGGPGEAHAVAIAAVGGRQALRDTGRIARGRQRSAGGGKFRRRVRRAKGQESGAAEDRACTHINISHSFPLLDRGERGPPVLSASTLGPHLQEIVNVSTIDPAIVITSAPGSPSDQAAKHYSPF